MSNYEIYVIIMIP